MQYDCLIIDDELAIAQSTSEYFNLFEVSSAFVTSYEEAIAFLSQHTACLLLLDINLNGKSGFELCKKLREETDVPILFISARGSDDDVLTALSIGGDDYIQKPFTLSILLAKVKAVLKRCRTTASAQAAQTVVVGHVVICPDSHKVLSEGKPVRLKEMEFRLLSYLANHHDRVIPKEELLERVWPDPFVGEGTLSVHVRHLREKLEKDPNHPKLIKTIWGIGYRLDTDETC